MIHPSCVGASLSPILPVYLSVCLSVPIALCLRLSAPFLQRTPLSVPETPALAGNKHPDDGRGRT